MEENKDVENQEVKEQETKKEENISNLFSSNLTKKQKKYLSNLITEVIMFVISLALIIIPLINKLTYLIEQIMFVGGRLGLIICFAVSRIVNEISNKDDK